MQYYELTPEELAILKDFEEGKFKPIKNQASAQAKYKKYTTTHLTKTKNVNIRLSEKDLLTLKSKAMEEGIPYQTLTTSIIHKYLGGRLKQT